MQPAVSRLTSSLYHHALKPVFFQLDPELVHNSLTWTGEVLGSNPISQSLLNWAWAYQSPSLHVIRDGIVFPNPIGLSAGFDYHAALTGVLPSVGFGWHTIGTITYDAYEGNAKPRLGRLPDSKALIVNKGLKNEGAEMVAIKLEHKRLQIPTGISIASTNRAYNSEKEQIEDIIKGFEVFEFSRVQHAYYELNISCPNTFGGEPFATVAKLRRLMKQMDNLRLSKPLYVKMPIDLSVQEVTDLLDELGRHRVEGVIFGNLTKDRTNPAVTPADRAIWMQRKGNLSGKPTWDRSMRLVKLTRKHCGDRFTIVGTGGIFTPEDAWAKLEAGADLLQLITGMIYEGPQVIGQMNQYIDQQRLATRIAPTRRKKAQKSAKLRNRT